MVEVRSGSLTVPVALDIAANLALVQQRIRRAARGAGRDPDGVTLVAVSKTFPPHLIAQAHAAGVRHFGENWVQEAQAKIGATASLDPHPTWHMVGHLQTNKVRAALDLFDVIQSVDSLHLAEAIARRTEAGRRVPVLLEVNAAGEASKYGFPLEAVPAAVDRLRELPGLDLRGLMTVAPAVSDPETLRPLFRGLRDLRDRLGLTELSMGMSEDFEVAIQEGATIVRIGRAVFGPRQAG